MRKADRASPRVRLAEVLELTAAKHLRPCLQVDVDLEPDDGFPQRLHRSRSGTVSKPSACSSTWPTRKSVFSPNCRPISCRPTGSPSLRPQGMFRPGSPAMHDG